ncbi:hypothetical protein WG68_13965 [Arsukibacterium ikkense]|uniref:Response regulatory domain-containing protein n=1 Tax=Arsukibacterium ikkense TaxID=336831 RepID=A0A0M2V1F5_9GAMM|nr:hypothetical protein [Arsukibacterium ikkense]KKO44657.1 hypothetical protein WG68_13965 [Arsukibacterium ikkense]
MPHILLARPHPFIVSEMAPFLQEQGFRFNRLLNLDALNDELAKADAAVISLAITSPLPQSAEELLAAIRHIKPSMPIVFASLLPLERVQNSILRLMQAHHQQAAIAAAGQMVGAAHPGQPATALYFCKDDLADAIKRDAFSKLLKLHAKH